VAKGGSNTGKKAHRMKTLVTGGAGFIASNLGQLLLKEGHRANVLDNLRASSENSIRVLVGTRISLSDAGRIKAWR